MADRNKVALTKQVAWRGGQEQFSNVYIIEGIDTTSTSAMQDFIDDLVQAEKQFHANIVSFVRAQIWEFENEGQNYMPYSMALSGNGVGTPTASMYRECAVMLRARLPRTTGGGRSVQPYLRKYFHTCISHGVDPTGETAPTWAAPGAQFAQWITLMNSLTGAVSLQGNEGTEPVGAWERSNFMEHRQFHRGRKET